MDNYVSINSNLWDKWANDNCVWSTPISHEEFIKISPTNYSLFASPITPIPKQWIGDVRGKRVLCLASAGGQQAPIFSALGADVTVFDVSIEQLKKDILVAERENLNIKIVQGDMTKPLPFEDGAFDLIFNPVSTTYIREVEPLWKECYRILAFDGKLITAIANPVVFAFDIEDNKLVLKYKLPYDPFVNIEFSSQQLEAGGVQFSHSLTTQIGGQLKAGLIMMDMFEDWHHLAVPQNRNEQMKPAQIAQLLTQYLPIYIVTLSKKQ